MRSGLIVVGNLNVDTILSVPNLPGPGESVPVKGRDVRFGGCGGNIALAAARLGVRTSLSSVVGPDLDPDYRRRLALSGIDLSGLFVIEGETSPYCIVLSARDGSQSYAFHMGAMARQGQAPVPGPGQARFCHVATSDPGYSAKVIEEMSGHGVETALDPGQEIFFRWDRPALKAALDHAWRFFGNLGEWRRLGEIMGWSMDVVPVHGHAFPLFQEAFGPLREAVVTLGGAGSVLVTAKGPKHEPPMDIGTMVDATGAGDAFRGAFYAAMERGISSGRALRAGNAMGAFSLGFDGPQEYEITWDQLETLMRPAQLAHHSSQVR